jgi:subtilisin-like proprotein convertase family protein
MAGLGFEAAAAEHFIGPQLPHVQQSIVPQDNGFQDATQRIVNGDQTSGYEAVGYVGPLGCTGTLISPTHVLTAAHCLEGVGNTQASFEVGGQTYQSSNVTIHPDYNPNNFSRGDDIAIIELNRPVNGIDPMQINRTTPQVGTMLTLVGFGEGGTSTGGFDPNDIGKQVGQTELEGVTAEHITWKFDSHNESNTAPGDSGGPAFINVGGQQLIAGVTSGGSGDAHTLGDNSFDTRVDVHASWIDGIVGTTDGGGGDDGDGGEDGGAEEDDHSNNPTQGATKITLNQNGTGTATGSLEVTGDRDAFEFTLAESGETMISLTGTSNDLDTYLRVYNSGGKLIYQNDDSGGTLDSELTMDLAAGKYFAVAGSYADDGTGDFRMDIQHDADENGGGNQNGTQTFTNNESQEIDDSNRDRVVSFINVSGMNGKLTDVNVEVDIDHTWTSDLRLILVAPDKTRVVLANRIGDDGDNFDRTVFDQDASQSIRQQDAPFRGTFRPMHSLDKLIGKNPNGRWKLVVVDFVAEDGGSLNNWSVSLTTDTARQRTGDASADFANSSNRVRPVSTNTNRIQTVIDTRVASWELPFRDAAFEQLVDDSSSDGELCDVDEPSDEDGQSLVDNEHVGLILAGLNMPSQL